MIFGIVLFPRALSRQGKTQEFFDKFKAGIRTHNLSVPPRAVRAISMPRAKNPRVRKIRVRNSGAGNGSPNFMDTWKKCVLSAGKPPCP